MGGLELEADRGSFAGDSGAIRDDTERVDFMLGLCSGSGDGGGDGSSDGIYLCAYGLELPVLVLERCCGRELRAGGCCFLCHCQLSSTFADVSLTPLAIHSSIASTPPDISHDSLAQLQGTLPNLPHFLLLPP